jgi:tRNA-specific 2-thiouridylase
MATGHYAPNVHGDPAKGAPHRLYRAVDTRKDPSYVLYTMDQEQLGYVRFPLGDLTKGETRRLARAFGLPVAEKAESQEICFVGNGRGAYAEFVAARRPDVSRPGEIVDTGGRVVGAHRGIVHHTVGQRRGLGIAARAPLYVVGLDPDANRVVVGSRAEAAAQELALEAVSLTAGAWPGAPFAIEAVVRYRGTPYPAEVRLGPAASGEATLSFTGDGPVASPGQAVVFYQGNEVLGGGTIRAVGRGMMSGEG